MRELATDELSMVGGGVVPVIGAVWVAYSLLMPALAAGAAMGVSDSTYRR